MSRLMLINGQRAEEELRVAVVADGRLEEYQVEVAEGGQLRGNIYRGQVARIEPSLNAAFVEFGGGRHGFLAAHDLVAQAYHREPAEGVERRPRIDEVLERGRPILVQVTRDAMGAKGAVLTANLSLAGRYLVLTPFDPSRGLSRKVEDEAQRKTLHQRVRQLTLPEGCGYIIRTNAADQPKTELNRDLSALLRIWKQVQADSARGRGPRLLYSDQNLVIQALRDYLDTRIEQVIVDDEQLLQKAQGYARALMPRSKIEIVGYDGRVPIFSRYNLEPQIDAIYQRVLPLPGRGSIVVDVTEALTAIDVNSGKGTGAATQGETALQTNLEAAEEVARQLRLRDIGGLVVVDFIDMRAPRDRRKVEKALKDAVRADRARVSVGRISENGLLEINRQRIHTALTQRTHRPCPTCKGLGLLASPERVGLTLLRRIEARAATGRLQAVRVALHPQLADAVHNQRRRALVDLEETYRIAVTIVADGTLHPAEEVVKWTDRPDGEVLLPPARPAAPAQPGEPAKTATVPVEPESREPEKPAEQAPRAKKRRRRGGRRTKRKSEDNEQPQASLEQLATDPEIRLEQADAEEMASEAVPAEKKRRRRRRRGGRRSSATTSE